VGSTLWELTLPYKIDKPLVLCLSKASVKAYKRDMAQEFYQQGIKYLEAGDRQGALQAFDRAIRAQPDLIEAYFQRGKLQFHLGDRAAAISDLSRAIKTCPQWAEAYLARALVYLATGDLHAAIADGEKALTVKPDLAAACRLLGNAHRQLGKKDRAIANYKQAAQLYLDQGDKSSARQCLDALAPLQPQARSPLVQAEDVLQQVSSNLDQGKYDTAGQDLNWLIQIDPQDGRLYAYRGRLRSKLGDSQGALSDLKQAMRLSPNDETVRLNRAIVRRELGDLAGAIADLTQLIQTNPQHLTAYRQRGLTALENQDYRQAIADFAQILSLRADWPDVYCDRAKAREQIGDFAGAIADYQAAADLWFNQGKAKDYQQALDQVKRLQVKIPPAVTQAEFISLGTATLDDRPADSLAIDAAVKELQQQLRRMVGGNWALAQRLLDLMAQEHPNMPEIWYLEQVIADLERDRD